MLFSIYVCIRKLASYDQGNYTQAIQYYDKVLKLDPNNKLVLNNKGNALYDQGNYTQAIQYYDKVLKLDPNFKSASDHKQKAFSKMGNVSSADGGSQ